MTREIISDAIGLIEDGLIAEAGRLRGRSRQKRLLIRLAAAAAAVVLIAYAGRGLLSRQAQSSLPLLEVWDESVGGMGYEGYLAYDISELTSANPWRESMSLKTLPVYRNKAARDQAGRPLYPDFEKMQALLLETAARLGIDTDTAAVTDDIPDEKTQQIITEKFQAVGEEVPENYFAPSELRMQGEGIEIAVDGSLTATISFDPPIRLPEGYTFAHDANEEQMRDAAGYLQEAYAPLLGLLKTPALDLTGGDYTYDGQQSYGVEFFDNSGGKAQRIVNFNFKRIAFYPNDTGELFLARVFSPDLSEKVGDYPIISLEEARQLLCEGHYLTSVPYAMPGEGYIRRAELIYRTSGREPYAMPYYRFYVELPDEKLENSLNDYGAYYVPAVESAYLTGLPTWDGSFN